ncbi:MAG: DUF2278 family protein [Segetibacter sp.]
MWTQQCLIVAIPPRLQKISIHFFIPCLVYQDGGLFIYYPDEQRWVAMFLKFQSQFVHTDDQNADPTEPPAQDPVSSQEETAIKIFAALVNPKADDVEKKQYIF